MTGRTTGKRRRHRQLAGLCLLAAVALTPLAHAQSQQRAEHPQARQSDPNVFDKIGDWFDRQFSNVKSDIRSAKDKFDRDAKSTWDTAKDAADAVVKLPDQRSVRGRERCPLAANGAPDCETAANNLCRSKGYGSGKSIDATSAENCPPRVLLSGRQPAPGECKTETFISRALCSP